MQRRIRRGPSRELSPQITLLAMALASIMAALPVSAQSEGWFPSTVSLRTPRAYPSVFFYNETFLIIGGCGNTNCTEQLNVVEEFDVEHITGRVLPDLPITISIEETAPPTTTTTSPPVVTNSQGAGESTSNDTTAAPTSPKPTPQPTVMPIPTPMPPPPELHKRVKIAGPTAAIPVGRFDPLTMFSSPEIITRVWVVGACSMFIPFTSSQPDPTLYEQYRYMWGLDEGLAKVEHRVQVPNGVNLRANASCQAYGNRIYIIGGVSLANTSNLLDTIDAYDVYEEKYYQNVMTLPEPIMNAAVTVDNNMMHVVGGQTSHCPKSDPNPCMSRKVTSFLFSSSYWIDEDTPVTRVPLPDNTFLQIVPEVDEHQPEHLPHVVSFNGCLFVMDVTQRMSMLNLSDAGNKHGSLTAWQSIENEGSIDIHASTLIAFPLFDNYHGSVLTFYSFGGIGLDEHGVEPAMSNRIFLHASGVSLPGINPNTQPAHIEIHEEHEFTLIPPPTTGFGRLSTNLACYGTLRGTNDTAVQRYTNDGNNKYIAFTPADISPRAYLCFSYGNMTVRDDLPKLRFFNTITAFRPLSIVDTPVTTPTPTASPSSSGDNNHTLLYAAIGIFASLVVISGLIYYRVRTTNSTLADRLLNTALDDNNAAESATDSLVRNTTSDSRYRMVRRIGAGSFSTVYVVRRKQDGEVFALKFMICTDDRERLEAIKECETINTIQGHPNIITLYDMFMNYEFGFQKRSSVLSETDQKMMINQSMSSMRAIEPNGHGNVEVGGTTPPPKYGATDQKYSPREGNLQLPNGKGDPTTPPAPDRHTRFLCLVMEYHPGGDLARFVLKHSPSFADMRSASYTSHSITSNPGSGGDQDDFLQSHAITESALLSVAYQLCSVLNHLHCQKPPIVHRDLKPENVLLKGTPKRTDSFLPIVVTDFGLAFIQEDHRKSGKGGGTRPYISPESWKGQVSTASDVWSLGCVLYAVATERLTVDSVRVMFLEAKSPTFRDDIVYDLKSYCYSEAFAHFVASILVVDPKRRPTAAQLLTRFVRNEDGSFGLHPPGAQPAASSS